MKFGYFYDVQIFNTEHTFTPQKSKILISEPFLLDPNFKRSAIYLVEHNEEGSVGYIINKTLPYNTIDVAPDLFTISYPIYYGGPVETNTLHFIHQLPDQIPNSIKVEDNIYWGGDFDALLQLCNQNVIGSNQLKFFLGYSGWAPNQLAEEMKLKSWWVATHKNNLVFNSNTQSIWQELVKSLGPDFKHLANAPEDFLLN